MIREDKKLGFEWEKEEDEFLENFIKNSGSTFKTLVGLYKGHYLSLFMSVMFFFIKHSPTWILPLITANIINIAINPGDDFVSKIVLNITFMIIMTAQNVLTNYAHVYLYSKTIRNMERNLRGSLVRKLQQLSISFHNSIQSGRLQSKIMRDVEQVETLSRQVFISVLSIIMNIAVSLGIVISKSMTVFAFFVVTVPIAVVIMVSFKGKIKSSNRVFRKDMEETSARVMEMVEMIPVTRAHALERRETANMEEQLAHMAESGLKLDVIQSYFSSISWVAFQIAQIVCLGFTGYMAATGKISVGEVTMYQTYFATIVAQVSNIITLLPTITKGFESVDSIGDILLSMDVEDDENKKKLKSVEGAIQFSHVSYRYPEAEEPVLKDLNLSINKGETIALVGGSGAGKTTILNLIIGFIRPTGGQIFIDGQDAADINFRSFRKHISVVPQTSILFTGTIRDNITYGNDKITDEQLAQVIEAANLTDFIASLPEGVDTKVTEHGANLSGGQRQRISIARAFARDPKVLILDEATSALDSISEAQIQKAVDNLVKDRTTLIVAHRLSTIRNADKIAVIGNGGLEEFGTYDELMTLKGRFYELKELQM